MFHTTHIHVPRNRRPSALRTFITSSSFGPPDTKEPLRRGILLTAVAFVLLLIGSIITWLGFNDVFGGRMSMTGPLLIALSLLLLLLSFRQFLLARKQNTNSRSSMPLDSVNGESVTAVVVNHDDGLHPATIILDRYNRMRYDGSVALHRPSDADCAPPSYQEVTRHRGSGSSNTPSCITTHEGQDELPPTYEETMGSVGMYPPHHLPMITLNRQERGNFAMPASAVNPISSSSSALRGCTELGARGVGGRDLLMAAQAERERDVVRSAALTSISSMFPHYTHKPSPLMMPDTLLTAPQPEGAPRVGVGGVGPPGIVPNLSSTHPASLPPRPVASACSVMQQPTQHNLVIPSQQIVSAPASPRQLSAPPSPHPYSAPPSPRQVPGPTKYVGTPPLHYADSGQQLSAAPPTLNLLSAAVPAPAPYPYSYSGPPSPINFSAPPSPRPLSSGQHSLTPPPQYTSAPPSPRQMSAPPSPLMFASPPPLPPPPPHNNPYFMSHIHPPSPQPPAPSSSSSSLAYSNPPPPVVPRPSVSCHLPGPPQPTRSFSSTPQPHHHSHHHHHQQQQQQHLQHHHLHHPHHQPSPQPWTPAPSNVGSSSCGSSSNSSNPQDGYTCFTYNFITPLPVETSPSHSTLHGHSSTISYPTARANSNHSASPGNFGTRPVGDIMPAGRSLSQSPAMQGGVYAGRGGRAAVPKPAQQPGVNVFQGSREMSQHHQPSSSSSSFPSRTDIQANI